MNRYNQHGNKKTRSCQTHVLYQAWNTRVG